MAELWERYQREYEKQEKLRELRTDTGFKRRVDRQLELMHELNQNWKKFNSLERQLFQQFFGTPIKVYDILQPITSISPSQSLSFPDHVYPENEAKVGAPPAYANGALCEYLLSLYLASTGAKPTKYVGQPCIKYVEKVFTELHDYVDGLFKLPHHQTPPAKQLLAFKSIGSKCLEVIKNLGSSNE